jgi:hypothetical protein
MRTAGAAAAWAVALLLAVLATACGDGVTAVAPDAAVADAGQTWPTTVTCADPPPGPAGAGDVAAVLAALPGVADVSEGATTVVGYRAFTFTLRQLVDHSAPGGATFTQRLALMHHDPAGPTVLGTQGYDLAQLSFREEPTVLLGANQVEVEHRFFAASLPTPADWSKLDIWQAAADHHCAVVALRALYPGRWLATGASKGGMAAVFHRRFFPDDVTATVAYVAPLSLAGPDPRYVDAVETGLHPECRQKLRDFQRMALGRRDAMEPRMQSSGLGWKHLGVDVAFEHVVLELPFGFWQYGAASDCDAIPTDASSDDAVFAYLRGTGDLAEYADALIDHYGPYYVQAADQLGWPEMDEQPVADLLRHPGSDRPDNYVPAGVRTSYSPAPMHDVDAWVRTQGERLLFIYGESDPWSGGMFELGAARDSLRLIVADGNHDSNIRQLGADDRAAALAALSRWMGVTAALPSAKPGDEAPRARRRLGP